MLPRINHYGYGIIRREDVIENVVYVSPERVIPFLDVGDRIRIQRDGQSYGQLSLTVTERDSFAPTVETDSGRQFQLFKSWEVNLESRPWLRRDGTSHGAVSRLTVVEKAD